MINYPESELIITSEGAVYHLNLMPGEIAETVILVGDPGRVVEVSRHFDAIEIQKSNREFVTHTGRIGQSRISCISTGIGTDNIDIVLNELDACVNINLPERVGRKERKTLRLVRIGTTGSLQPDLDVDQWVTSAYVIGLDGLLNYYKYNKSNEQIDMIEEFISRTDYPNILTKPYAFKASENLLKLFTEKCRSGITLTAPGFYAPQGRKLRYELMYPELVENYARFEYNGLSTTNLEMETSALYGLGTLLSHEVCTVCAVVANRVNRTFSKDGHKAVEGLIKFVLEQLIK